MVNNSNPIPPSGSSPINKPEGPTEPSQGKKVEFNPPSSFLGMQFTQDQWTKLMNIMIKNLSDYINKSFQKSTEKMKKDWKRGQGDDPGD